MHRLKIVGLFILGLSVALAFVFDYTSEQSSLYHRYISLVNQQKSYTQEISKSVLYLSKNRGASSVGLERATESFLANMTHQRESIVEHDTLVHLWEQFYTDVKKFRDEYQHATLYSTITMDKLVNRIYMQNQQLLISFDHFLDKKERYYRSKMQWYKGLSYALLAVVILLLAYLFTQFHGIMAFVQKFSHTSKSIIQKASIKGVEPLSVTKDDVVLREVTENFNTLLDKINRAVGHAEVSIDHTTLALEEVESKVEDFLTLVTQMQEESRELSQKEDAVIDALEVLMSLTAQLKGVKTELSKLTSSANCH